MTHGSINVNRYKCCGFLFDSGFKLKEKILKNGISKEANTFFNTLESFFIFVNFISPHSLIEGTAPDSSPQPFEILPA